MKKKICSSCKIKLNVTEFYKQNGTKDGLDFHCKKCHRLLNKKWYEKNKEKRKLYTRNWWKNNPQKVLITAKKYRDKVKDKIIKVYGGYKCKCCGETEPLFLTIDHINGGGCKHRKAMTGTIYTWLKKNNYPKEYQVLCYNCNSGKWRNGGICPHQKGENG